MGGFRRFCGQCGHELKQGARFCGTCGHSRPGNGRQTAATDSAHDPRAETGSVLQEAEAPPGDRQGDTIVPAAASRTIPDQGWSPAAQVLPSATPPLEGTPARMARPPNSRRLLVAGLVVLLAAGGTVAALVLLRHSDSSHPAAGIRHSAPKVSPAASTTPSATPTTAPPTQLNIQGLTIGIGTVNTDPDVTAVADTIAAYFGGIDARNYMQAWDLYTPALQAAIPLQPWSSALSTTQDSQIVVQSIQHDPSGAINANVLFQSHQAPQYGPNPGETCTNWSLDYRLVASSSAQAPSSASSSSGTSPSPSGPATPSYLINKVTGVGAGHVAC